MDTTAPEIGLSEVISALPYALDVTEGQPVGHAARTCVIGMKLADAIGLPAGDRSSLFYALLLKDAGCSSNAAKVAALLGDDDQAAKRDRKTVDHRRSTESLRYVGRHLRPDGSPMQRATQLVERVRQGIGGLEDIHALRCERDAQVALSIELDTATAAAIRALDDHWDGGAERARSGRHPAAGAHPRPRPDGGGLRGPRRRARRPGRRARAQRTLVRSRAR